MKFRKLLDRKKEKNYMKGLSNQKRVVESTNRTISTSYTLLNADVYEVI